MDLSYNELMKSTSCLLVGLSRSIFLPTVTHGQKPWDVEQIFSATNETKVRFVNEKGNMINDPVVLRLKEDEWLVSIADNAIDLFASGLAVGMNMDVKIERTGYQIMAIQGKNSYELAKRVFGDSILSQKFFNYNYYNFEDTSFLVGNLGWTGQGGYEVWISPEQHKEGLDLYDNLFVIGKK